MIRFILVQVNEPFELMIFNQRVVPLDRPL